MAYSSADSFLALMAYAITFR